MRIIAGTLKGRRLEAPGPGNAGVRPTADRAREALFSILQRVEGGSFLDLCSGTGAVAVEAWSRGFHPVVALEQASAAATCIRRNARDTDIRIVAHDLGKGLKACGRDFTVIFADPPYADSGALFARHAGDVARLLAPEGLLIWETDRRTDLPGNANLHLVDDRCYGTTRFRFFRAPQE